MSTSLVAQPNTLSRPTLLAAGVIVAGAAMGATIATGDAVYLVPAMVLLMVVRWPVQVALGAYAFLVPFEQIPLLGKPGSGISPTFFAGILTLITLTAVGLAEKRFLPPTKSALWWTCFVVWGTLVIGWSVDSNISMARLRTAYALLAIYLLVTSFRLTKAEFSAVRFFAITGGLTAATITVIEMFSGIHFTGTHRGTLVLRGFEADPNYFAAALMVPFSLAVGGLMEGRGIRRIAMAGVAVVIIFAVIVTGSRGGMLGLMASTLVFLMRMRIDKRVVAIALCAALLLALLPSSFLARITKSDDGGANRLEIWSVGVQAVPRYMLQGAGWDNFWLVFTDYTGGIDALALDIGRGCHNLLLGMTIEVGLLGVFLLIMAMRSQLKGLRSRELVPFEAGCWGVLITSMFLDPVWRNAFWFCWVMIAIATRLQRRIELTESAE